MEACGEGLRANRTQEVAGSSPASSIRERPARAHLSFSEETPHEPRGQVLVKSVIGAPNACTTVPSHPGGRQADLCVGARAREGRDRMVRPRPPAMENAQGGDIRRRCARVPRSARSQRAPSPEADRRSDLLASWTPDTCERGSSRSPTASRRRRVRAVGCAPIHRPRPRNRGPAKQRRSAAPPRGSRARP